MAWLSRDVPDPLKGSFNALRLLSFVGRLLSLWILFLVSGNSACGLSLQELRDDPNLTPEGLMAYFRDFEFKLDPELQDPEVFLATRSGDCDDFASLAATLLSEKQYTTQLVAVFMDGRTHVVCYVQEVHGYLDYNCREQSAPLQTTDGKLEDIADKVAAYFRQTWRCVAEFRSKSGIRRFGRIAFR
jgi:hypothetical protein